MINNYQPIKLAGSGTDYTINNPILNDTLKDIARNRNPSEFFALFLPKIVGLALLIGVLVFFFMLLISSIQWIASGGDKTSIEAARGKITNALMGMVILFSLFALLKFIEGFFGINILILDIGALKI